MPSALFALVGLVVIVAAVITVTRRNPIHAALSMLVALGGIAALMLGLRSPFLAAMQVLLYGGAIMVLFTFVIMLLTLREDELGKEAPIGSQLGAFAGACGTALVIYFAIGQRGDGASFGPVSEQFGSTEHFARFLYTDYVVAFELVTVLVMAAVAGVIVLARRPDKDTLEGTRLTAGHRQALQQDGGAQ